MSSTQTSSLVVRLLDQVTGPAAKMASSLRNLMSAANGNNTPFGSKLTSAIEKNNRALASSRGRLFDAAASAYALKGALGAPIAASIKFETALEDIGQKGEIAQNGLTALGERIKAIATQTANLPSQMAGGVDFLIGMGMQTNDALSIIPDIGKASTAFRADITDLSKAGYAALNNLDVKAKDFAYSLDIMAKSGQLGGFELKDMAQYFPALTVGAKSLGMNGVKAIADLGAALQVAVTGAANPEAAANNLANFFQKIPLKETVKNFKKFGVNVQEELNKLEKNGGSAIEHFSQIVWNLSKGGKDATAVSAIFGDKQVIEYLRPMMTQMDRYRKIRAESMNAAGLTNEMYERRTKTALFAQMQFTSSLERLNIMLGSILLPTFVKITNAVTNVIEKFERLSDQNKGLVKNVTLAVSGLIAFRIAAIGVRHASLLAWGGILNIVEILGVLKNAIVGVTSFLSGGIVLAFGRLAMAARAVALGFAINGAGAGLAAFGGVLAAIAAPAALFIAAAITIGAAGYWIYNNWKSITSMFESFGQGFSFAMREAAPLIKEISELLGDTVFGKAASTAGKWLGQLGDWLNNILGPVDANGKAWDSLGVRIGKGFGGWIVAAIGHVRDLIKFLGDIPAILSKTGAAITKAFTFSGGPGVSAGGATELGGGGGLDGARANGGPVKAGGNYLVGERGPELAYFPKAGTIIPNHALRGGGKAGDTTIAPTFNITVNGNADAGDIEQRVRRALREETQSLVRSTYSDLGFA